MKIFIRYQLESSEVVAGFQTTVLPIMSGAIGRLAAKAVKLNGEMAYTKPSSGLYSTWLISPGPPENGWDS